MGESPLDGPNRQTRLGFLVQRNIDILFSLNEPVKQEEIRDMFKFSEIYEEKFKVCVINC